MVSAITPASRKAKARKLQQWAANQILYNFPQLLSTDDVKSTPMGVNSEDVTFSKAAKEYVPFAFECKSRNTIGLYKWYNQLKPPLDGRERVLIIKQDRAEPLAVVDAKFFLQLMGEVCNDPRYKDLIRALGTTPQL